MAKAKKLPSGNWRVQVFAGKTPDGKRIYKSFTAETERKANLEALAWQEHRKAIQVDTGNMTLGEGIDEYICSSDGVLSPTTILGYKKIRKNSFQSLMDMKMNKITTNDLKKAVNNEAKRRQERVKKESRPLSPKTIKNAYGLISSVLRIHRPDLDTNVPLPATKNIIKEVLPPEVIFDVVKGTDIELPTLLAMWLSFSMSEIRGLTKSKSINGDYITIREVVVDADGEAVRKEQAKAFTRTRRLKMPAHIKALVDAVDGDIVVPMTGQAIYKRFARLLEKNELPHMAFHDLRHVNASVMAQLGIPDKYAMERGGWKTDKVMKRVYQHTFSEQRKAVDDMIDSYFESKMQHDMQHKK